MIDTLIVVKNNRYGLTQDGEVLAEALRAAGVETRIAGIRERSIRDRLSGRTIARRVIHIERVFPNWVSAGLTNILIPNQERFPRRHLGRLRGIDLVLAKTREALDAFAGEGARVEYLGFTSQDRLDIGVAKNWDRVLHLAGGSTLKGTEDVLALWEAHPDWPELVLVQKHRNAPHSVPANVRLIRGYVPDDELRRLQNECGIHLCPSRAEGWGHNLVEGLACGAVVVATDAPPMNEHVNADCGVLVRAGRTERRHVGVSHFVDRKAFEQAIQGVLDMHVAQKAELGALARRRYEEIAGAFPERVARLLANRSAEEATAPGPAPAPLDAGRPRPVGTSWLNRPAQRYLVRLYCLQRYGWANSHAEEWWPNLALKAPSGREAGAILYRDRQVAPLLPFPAPLDGGEIVVVGTGPSLAGQAVDRIPLESALLLNGAIHLLDADAPLPLGVVIEDERFVWRQLDVILQKVRPGTRCFFSTSVIRALCDTTPDWLAGRAVHHLDFVHRPYGRRRPDGASLRKLAFLRWSGDGKAAISIDPGAGLMPAGSVAASAAQIALALAPARIGLAGIDLTNTEKPRFYETAGDQAMSRIGAASDRILATFRVLAGECASRGIALENYSPASRLAEIGVAYSPRLEK
ncbi:glycosyltransferase [Mesorhizobium sp. ZMM04-5]|uniref:Glycosyltransferase n=1 Tax=Mesorhizobium marinum TaxID=3228790 RepID=A0ABV3R006_9HYPH